VFSESIEFVAFVEFIAFVGFIESIEFVGFIGLLEYIGSIGVWPAIKNSDCHLGVLIQGIFFHCIRSLSV